jgi:hypothetical protein
VSVDLDSLHIICDHVRDDINRVYSETDTTGLCGVGSVHLYNMIKNRMPSTKAVMCMGVIVDKLDTHCWVEVDDQFVVDVTCDQFPEFKGVSCHIVDFYHPFYKKYRDHSMFYGEQLINEIELWDHSYIDFINKLKIKNTEEKI